MTANPLRLAPSERRAILLGTVYRIVGTPVVAALSLVNTAIVVRETGPNVFGFVTLIATLTLLFPFADLGIGATVLTASAELHGTHQDRDAIDVIRRGYRVLLSVAVGLIAAALVVMAFDGWHTLLGMSSGSADRWAITAAVSLFALTIPAGLGVRILIGVDLNHLAALALMSNVAFGLGLTVVFASLGVEGIWYAIPPLAGVLAGNLLATIVALRRTELGFTVFAPVGRSANHLLKGSLWLFIAGVGLPIGLQSGRLLLAHFSTPVELSEYALMAQLYAAGWLILATAGIALWPVFVKRRDATDATVRIWWMATVLFTAVAALGAAMIAGLAPWVATILSGGQIDVSVGLALSFGALLIVQACHLPAGVLLTKPSEARWQAYCIAAMAAITVGFGVVLAGPYGALGVVVASVLGVGAGQVIPDLVRVPRIVRRRPLVGAGPD